MKRRNQLILIATVAVLAVAVHFVSRQMAGRVFYSGPEFVVLLGDGKALDAQGIQDIVKSYAAELKISFDFSQSDPLVMLTPLDTNVLAKVYFRGALGQPFLNVEIDREGKVLRHVQGIMKCGVSSQTSNSKPETPL
jgi:hypothetical protein